MWVKWWKYLLLFLLVPVIYGQQQQIELKTSDIIQIPEKFYNKIGSGDLVKDISKKKFLWNTNQVNKLSDEKTKVVLYLKVYPSIEQLNTFQSLGLECDVDSWTPPIFDHPYGFIFANLPVSKLIDVLTLDFVKKIDDAEQLSLPQNNESEKVINADQLWFQGLTGEGVTVGILDSGLDTDPLNPDLPSKIIKKDYSNYPTIDDDVENHITGHGTHVTGSVLGRGILSADNTGNGGNSYKGVAPSADLVFLKIGNDYTAGASINAIVNALDAAVNIYNVNVISMSYGSWDIYHDGSSVQEQKVDWCYSQGVPIFLAAGNEGASARHYSGTLSPNGSSEYIKLNINDVQPNSTYLVMNLVWFDGLGVHNNLSIKYYDDSFHELTNVYAYGQTESTKGTESKISLMMSAVPSGNSIYYLKVFNNTSCTQEFHLYEHNRDPKVQFENPDPNYTVVSPANATYGFTVGAFTTREDWTSYKGTVSSNNEDINEIAHYSSRGPRIDGLQKPDIVAPGSSIISIRDRDVLNSPDIFWVDNDGNITGDANYYIMEGTSMATPQCAGAAALYLSKYSDSTPQEVYNALRNNSMVDQYTGSVPNSTYGYGKLDIYAAINITPPLPVELSLFSATTKGNNIILNWRTETEVNNYGFEIQRLYNNIEWEVIGFVQGYGNSNSPIEYSYTDNRISSPGNYSYRLRQIDNDGKYDFSRTINANFEMPAFAELKQNYPNPFNPSTTISFTLPVSDNISLKIFNLLGEEVTTLVTGFTDAGTYTLYFNAGNLFSGMYIYQLATRENTFTKKMLYLK